MSEEIVDSAMSEPSRAILLPDPPSQLALGPNTMTPSERAQRVSHASGAGIAGVPASERVGGSGGAKPPG